MPGAPFQLLPTLEHGSLSVPFLLLLPEELVAGTGAGQEQPESLRGRRRSGRALRGLIPLFFHSWDPLPCGRARGRSSGTRPRARRAASPRRAPQAPGPSVPPGNPARPWPSCGRPPCGSAAGLEGPGEALPGADPEPGQEILCGGFLLSAYLGKLLPIRMRPKGYSLPCTVTGGLTSKFPKESRLEAPSGACRAT